ncbi:hypothetical protein M011DRAFT_273655 [Sporormia fimetaria CBS 119925]|uniref:Uncharacterized protein n=1 Tax=Sporormia fimetaria CBS 119925 TaxID=1340428 RepID=A0A6A6VJ05_9PLEO|nr:hypothetical protein M011DRAFT_273655 [Sporormia fimetaria CBS 119925]
MYNISPPRSSGQSAGPCPALLRNHSSWTSSSIEVIIVCYYTIDPGATFLLHPPVLAGTVLPTAPLLRPESSKRLSSVLDWFFTVGKLSPIITGLGCPTDGRSGLTCLSFKETLAFENSSGVPIVRLHSSLRARICHLCRCCPSAARALYAPVIPGLKAVTDPRTPRP